MNDIRFTVRLHHIPWLVAPLVAIAVVLAWLLAGPTSVHATNERIVTIYSDGQQRIVATEARTVSEVLQRADITLRPHDVVEPSGDTELVAANYNINVYRAQPVTIADGTKRLTILTSRTSPKDIAVDAGLQVYDEDVLTLSRVDNFVAERAIGLLLTIQRSTPIKAIIYDKPVELRTRARTVGEFIQEKNIKRNDGDKLWPDTSTPITNDLVIALYRDGSQAVTYEDIPFATEHVHDGDRPIGYRAVKEKGETGKRFVVYTLDTKQGRQVKVELQSVVIAQPRKQIEVLGTKSAGFSGDFATALARLRSCEGKYTSINPIGYYGAYQFNVSTWRGYAPEGYKDTRPDQAPPAVQDQAARNLYQKRGWQPWPACSAKLGLRDVYR